MSDLCEMTKMAVTIWFAEWRTEEPRTNDFTDEKPEISFPSTEIPQTLSSEKAEGKKFSLMGGGIGVHFIPRSIDFPNKMKCEKNRSARIQGLSLPFSEKKNFRGSEEHFLFIQRITRSVESRAMYMGLSREENALGRKLETVIYAMPDRSVLRYKSRNMPEENRISVVFSLEGHCGMHRNQTTNALPVCKSQKKSSHVAMWIIMRESCKGWRCYFFSAEVEIWWIWC